MYSSISIMGHRKITRYSYCAQQNTSYDTLDICHNEAAVLHAITCITHVIHVLLHIFTCITCYYMLFFFMNLYEHAFLLHY